MVKAFRDELWSSREMVGNARAAAEGLLQFISTPCPFQSSIQQTMQTYL